MRNLLFSFINYFVPDTYAGSELRMRAQIVIVLISLSISRLVAGLIIGAITGAVFLREAGIFYFYIFLQIAFLFFLKFFKQVEWTAFIYSFLVLSIVTLEVVFKAKSIAYSSFQLYTTLLVFSIVAITDSRKRLALLGISICLSSVAIYTLKQSPIDLNYSFALPNFTSSYLFAAVTTIAYMIGFMMIFTRLKDNAIKAQVDEIESRIASAKLHEVSSLTQSLFPDLAVPLKNFQKEVLRLNSVEEKEVHKTLDSLHEQLINMKNLSSSIGWIYRAYRGDRLGHAPNSYIQSQLAYLLERKLSGTGIQLHASESLESFLLGGPIPTIFLLKLKVLELALAQEDFLHENGVEFSLYHLPESNRVCFELVWFESGLRKAPLIAEGQDFHLEFLSPEFIRQETIGELIRESGAEIVEIQEGKRYTLRLLGAWLIKSKLEGVG